MTRTERRMMSTADAGERLEITADQFRRLAARLGLVPDATRPNPRYRSAAPMLLYRRGKIAAFARRALVREFVAGAKVRGAAAAHAYEESALAKRAAEQAEIDALRQLDTDVLVAQALAALHALNRAAKHDRRWGRDTVYPAKDRMLDALIRADRASIEYFDRPEMSREQTCGGCDRSWIGDPYCYVCDDYTGGEMVTHRWYVVDCGHGYRFHRPELAPDLAARGMPIPPHDPTQPPREIPDTGLSIAAQLRCVAVATDRLIASIAPMTATE